METYDEIDEIIFNNLFKKRINVKDLKFSLFSLKSRVEFYSVKGGNKTIPIVDTFALRLDNL